MTHEELLAKINKRIAHYIPAGIDDQIAIALLAVVELHKPIQDKKLWCEGCRVEDDDWYSTNYPCPTIQQIIENLK